MLAFWNENKIVKLKYAYVRSKAKVRVDVYKVCHTNASVFVPWFTNMVYLHLRKCTHVQNLVSFYNHKFITPRHKAFISRKSFITHLLQSTFPISWPSKHWSNSIILDCFDIKFRINIIVLSESWPLSLRKRIFLVVINAWCYLWRTFVPFYWGVVFHCMEYTAIQLTLEQNIKALTPHAVKNPYRTFDFPRT